MTKRRRDLAAKLETDTDAPPPGWKDQIAPTPPPPKKETYKRKTYLVTPELVKRVKETAKREQVGQNELLRYLLTWALDELDAGRHEIPIEVERSHRIKYDQN